MAPFDIDENKVATFIMKNMLSYDKLDLNKIKAQFNLDDFGVRDAIIRLYRANKVFGKIVQKEDGRSYLVFSMEEMQKRKPSLEEILDWDLEQFELVGSNPEDTPRLESLKLLMQSVSSKTNQTQVLTASKRKETDQKDLISVEMNVKIIGIKTAIIIAIQNGSSYDATEGKMRLRYDSYLNVRPQFEDHKYENKEGELTIWINELPAKSTQTLRIYVQDINNRKFQINGFFQFRNNKHTMRLIKMEQINVDFNLPEIIPWECDVSKIKNIMKNSEYFKRMQGLGTPSLINMDELMSLFNEIMERHSFKLILKHSDPTPMWFYTAKIDGPEEPLEILAIPQVKNNFIAFYVCSKNKDIVSTLIHNISKDYQTFLINRKFLPTEFKLIDLNCYNCQTVLDHFPVKGMEVICPKCKRSQKVW